MTKRKTQGFLHNTIKSIVVTPEPDQWTTFASAHDNNDKGIVFYIKTLIKNNENIDKKDVFGKTPLFYVINIKEPEIVKTLIDHGADINAKDTEGKTPLHYIEDDKIAELLIKHGADVNLTDTTGKTPLFYAVYNFNSKIVKTLINHGADINAKDRNGATPLCYAPDVFMTDLLIEYGANIDVNAANERTPLFYAIHKRNLEIVKSLIKHGAKVNVIDSEKLTPLLFLLTNIWYDIDIVKTLIDSGIDINSKDTEGKSALLYATNNNQLDIIKLLLEHGANVDAIDNYGKQPLHYAQDQEIVKILIKYGADINAKDKEKQTLLSLALKHVRPNISFVKTLIDCGAIVDKKTLSTLNKLLFNNVKHNNFTDIQNLIECGANVNAKDLRGQTPIFYAIDKHNTEIIKLLTEHGAIIDHVTKRKLGTLLKNCLINNDTHGAQILLHNNLAINKNNTQQLNDLLLEAVFHDNVICAKILVDIGAEVEPNNNKRPLNYVKSEEMATLLLEHGADVNAVDYQGNTLLHRCHYTKIVKTLVEHGANINARNNKNETPLFIIRNDRYLNIKTKQILIDYLISVGATE